MGRAGDFALLSREDGCYGTGETAARDAAQPPRSSVGILGNFLCAGFGEAPSADRGSRGSPGGLPSRSAVLCRSYRPGAHSGRSWQQGRGSCGATRSAALAPTALAQRDSASGGVSRSASRSSLERGVEILTVTTTISRQASHSLKLSLGFSAARAQASADISRLARLGWHLGRGLPAGGLLRIVPRRRRVTPLLALKPDGASRPG